MYDHTGRYYLTSKYQRNLLYHKVGLRMVSVSLWRSVTIEFLMNFVWMHSIGKSNICFYRQICCTLNTRYALAIRLSMNMSVWQRLFGKFHSLAGSPSIYLRTNTNLSSEIKRIHLEIIRGTVFWFTRGPPML